VGRGRAGKFIFKTINTTMKKAVIKKVKAGKKAGQFRFELVGSNGETVAHSGTETYTQLHSCKETLQANFPDFKIIENF
jgi:uncharacterized protein YegP (UPF0339 family)